MTYYSVVFVHWHAPFSSQISLSPHTDIQSLHSFLFWLYVVVSLPFSCSAGVSHPQDYVNNQVRGITKWEWLPTYMLTHLYFHIFQRFSVEVCDIHAGFCVCIIVSEWVSPGLGTCCLETCSVGGESRSFWSCHTHALTAVCLTLWVADRKGADKGINRCMLGATTDCLTDGGGFCSVETFKPDGTDRFKMTLDGILVRFALRL